MRTKSLALITVVWSIASLLSAQFTSVRYDRASNWFNQGQLLPAEVDMVFSGTVENGIELVELTFFTGKHKDALHSSNWRRVGNENEFQIPVSFKLRADAGYDVQFDYYGPVTREERQLLNRQLMVGLDLIVAANQKDGTDIDFRQGRRKILKEMDEFLLDQMAEYRTTNDGWTPNLSALLELQLERMERVNLGNTYDRSDTTQTRRQVLDDAKSNQFEMLSYILEQELDVLLDVELYRLSQSRLVDDYRTERKGGTLSFNLGYAGVYLSGKWSDGTYGSSPYVGIALPLGNRVLGARFFRNAAFNVGVMLNEMDNGNGGEVRGFIIGQPIYVGLDYKLFQFVHFNAGGLLLNGNTIDRAEIPDSEQQLAVRPFVGLSARINLQLGLGR